MPPSSAVEERLAKVETGVAVLSTQLGNHVDRSEERHAALMSLLAELKADVERKRDRSDEGAPPIRVSPALAQWAKVIGTILGIAVPTAVGTWAASHGIDLPVPPPDPITVPAPTPAATHEPMPTAD